MRTKLLYAILALAFILPSCGGSDSKKEAPIVLPSQGGARSNRSVIKIPYTERGNVKIVPVKINDVSMDMIFDTGASGLHISLLELQRLQQNGQISESDYMGTSFAQIADGRIVENAVIRLRKVSIDNQINLENVNAFVSRSLDAPLLLGNNVLDQFSSVEIDNEAKTINFRKR